MNLGPNIRILCFADIQVEKGEFDILVLSFEKADSTFLLVYPVLRDPSINDVHTRS